MSDDEDNLKINDYFAQEQIVSKTLDDASYEVFLFVKNGGKDHSLLTKWKTFQDCFLAGDHLEQFERWSEFTVSIPAAQISVPCKIWIKGYRIKRGDKEIACIEIESSNSNSLPA